MVVADCPQATPVARMNAQAPAANDFITSSDLAGHALMAVFRSELLEQRNRFRVWLNALPRAVRHVGNRHAAFTHSVNARAFGNEIQDHCVIASGGGIVKSRESAIRRPWRRPLLLLLRARRCRA